MTKISIASRPLFETDHRAQLRPAGDLVRADAVINEERDALPGWTNVRIGST